MVKHIVIWKLKDDEGEAAKQRNALKMKLDIEALVQHIPEIIAIEVGFNFGGSDQAGDVALYSEFADRAALDTYLQHPAHLEVVRFVRDIVSERRVVDYEC